MHEKHKRHDENGRVKDISFFVALSEMMQFFVPSFLHDFLIQVITSRKPLISLGARK